MIDDDWTPTPDNINALPEPVRKYLHDLETVCDPAGIVAENTLAKDEIRMRDNTIASLAKEIAGLRADNADLLRQIDRLNRALNQ